jgi:carboxypeptidase Q
VLARSEQRDLVRRVVREALRLVERVLPSFTLPAAHQELTPDSGGKKVRPIRRFVIALVLAVSFLVNGVLAEQPGEFKPAAEQLAGAILIDGRSMTYLQDLTDRFGGRLTGTPAYNHAAEWAMGEFRAAGVTDVKLESFTIPNGWDRGWAHGRILSPLDRPLHIESLGWAPSTPAGGIKAEVVKVNEFSEAQIKAQADKIKGRVVMPDLAALFAEGFSSFGKFIAALQYFKAAGVAAIVVGDREKNNVLNAAGFNWGGALNPLPMAQIGMEDAKLIERLMEKGPVTIEFSYENKTSGPIQVNNVIAELKGREKPDEWIIVGAHLDSWDYGTGAQDNGTGCAMVLEAARAISTLVRSGHAPRRSIRFALWGGEEQGLLGSNAYVKAHDAELAKCIAVLNTDNGAGHPSGWKVEGRKDMEQAMKPICQTLLTGLSGGGVSEETSFDTDHGHFMLAGIPSLDLWVDLKPYGEVHHKTSDTIDKVDAHNLALGCAIVAVTAWVVAERSEPIASHLDHAAVGVILRKHNLEGFLKAVGVWN